VALGATLLPHSTVVLVGTAKVGSTVSRIVSVCTQVELLPQASVARHVREMTRALPQTVALESEKVTVTTLQISVAVATPVLLVVMFAGHSSIRFAGQVMTGGMVSRTVMVCVQLDALPQGSVAVQRRLIVRVLPQFGVMVST